MKKFFGILALALIVFIILMYWSLNTKPEKIENSILVNLDTIESIDFKAYDSVLIEATTQYKSNELKKIMQGEHYRKAWSTPVKVPVVFLDTMHGGLKIIDEGGGKQTKSLKLEASNGVNYTLRSINKKPDALIPNVAKSLGLENIIVDGISAQHPYGAIVVAELADKAQVLHTSPQIVFIPKQDRLDTYNETYGNRLYLLEYESDSKINWTNFQNVVEIVDTEDLQELKMAHQKNVTVDENALVRARLFDLIIGDWDRHSKQWGWVVQKQGDQFKAFPLPADRDNAFFNPGGVIPNLIANRTVRPEVQAFDDDIDYIPGLVQPFDVYFLQSIPESVFIDQANQLKQLLTDSAIEKSFDVWPKAIFDLDGPQIIEKIKSRRDAIDTYAKEFKAVLNKQPLLEEPLKGSEDLELSKELLQCFECHDKKMD